MFLSYAANIICMIFKLWSLPKGLKNLDEICDGLSEKERFKIHSKKFAVQFFKLLILNFTFLLIGVATCLLDGLSDTENGLLIPTFTWLIIAVILMMFFFVYSFVLKKKYKVDLVIHDGSIRTRGNCDVAQTATCVLISFIFAFNSALTAYTIWLIIFC